MSSVLATLPRALGVRGAPVPLIGARSDTYAGRQVLGAVIAVGLIAVIAVMRRYLAAKQAGLGFAQSAGFAIRLWAKPADKVQAPRGLLVGTDNRVSTSKTTAALWTVVLIYFIASMALIFGARLDKYTSLIQSISPLYLVLLGGPFAAAVLAKSIVSAAMTSEQVQKGQGTPRIADVFSDDDGNTDLVDTQYIAFNILVAVIVIIQFASHPGFGAPVIPGFLAALTGASAAAYVANKAITTGNPPGVTQLDPGQVRPEGQAMLYGQNLRLQGDAPKDVSVTVAGLLAPVQEEPPPTPTQLAFRVPPNAITGTVVVRTPSGLSSSAGNGTAGNSVLTIIPDAIQVTRIDSLSTAPGGCLTLYGSGFFNAADVDWKGAALAGSAPATSGLLTKADPPPSQQPQTLDCPPMTNTATQSDTQLTLSVPADAQPGSYQLTLRRGALRYDPSIVVQVSQP